MDLKMLDMNSLDQIHAEYKAIMKRLKRYPEKPAATRHPVQNRRQWGHHDPIMPHETQLEYRKRSQVIMYG